MSKIADTAPDNEDDDFIDFDIDTEDYGFILSPDGSIKALILPQNFTKAPATVEKICRILGIQDLDSLKPTYLH